MITNNEDYTWIELGEAKQSHSFHVPENDLQIAIESDGSVGIVANGNCILPIDEKDAVFLVKTLTSLFPKQFVMENKKEHRTKLIHFNPCNKIFLDTPLTRRLYNVVQVNDHTTVRYL